jgi:hypothetical protein
MLGRKKTTKMNKDPLLDTAATHAQGWFVEGGHEVDAEHAITWLTSKIIEEVCGPEQATELGTSAGLSRARERHWWRYDWPEDEPFDEKGIEFESDQEEGVAMDFEQVGENDD